MKKTLTLAMLLLSAATLLSAKKKTETTLTPLATIKDYPTAVADECFKSGTAVVRGTLHSDKFESLMLVVRNRFTQYENLYNLKADAQGNFVATIELPHSGYVSIDPFRVQQFVMVGDTLNITAYNEEATFTSTGVSGEINRLWAEVKGTCYDEYVKSQPWLNLDKETILQWRDQLVSQLDGVAQAINDGKILADCSPLAHEIVSTNLISEGLFMLAYGFQKYNRTLRNDRPQDTANRISISEFFTFLAPRQAWLIDNPSMILGQQESLYMVRFTAYSAYMKYFQFTSIDQLKECMQYNQEQTNTSPLTFAEQYTIMNQSIAERDEDIDDELVNIKSQQLAAAIPMISHPVIAQQLVSAYRQMIERHHPAVVLAAPETPADSLYQRIIAPHLGKVIYLYFWGTYCGPCRTHMIEQQPLVSALANKPVSFIYICNEVDSPRDMAERFLADKNIQGEHLFLTRDEWNLLSAKFQFQATPFALLIDQTGNIVSRKINNDEDAIEALLK